MSVGDRDYKQIVRDAIDSIGEDIQLKIDTKDSNIIYLDEATSVYGVPSMIEQNH